MERMGIIKMKKTLYLIIGPSGAGKDYAVDRLCKVLSNVKRVISRTTRKSRGPGDLHIFVDADTAGEEIPYSIARTDYNDNLYYVLPEDIEDADFYIIDPKGVDVILSQHAKGVLCLQGRNIVRVYLDVPLYIRVVNMIKRGDNISSIINRLMIDRVEFKNFQHDLRFKSSSDLYEYFVEWWPRWELSRWHAE